MHLWISYYSFFTLIILSHHLIRRIDNSICHRSTCVPPFLPQICRHKHISLTPIPNRNHLITTTWTTLLHYRRRITTTTSPFCRLDQGSNSGVHFDNNNNNPNLRKFFSHKISSAFSPLELSLILIYLRIQFFILGQPRGLMGCFWVSWVQRKWVWVTTTRIKKRWCQVVLENGQTTLFVMQIHYELFNL